MRLALVLVIASAQVTLAQEVPRVSVMYQEPDGSIFDRDCPRFTKAELKPDWIREVVRRRGEFQSAWDADGREYMRAALKEVGAPFPISRDAGDSDGVSWRRLHERPAALERPALSERR